MRHSVIALVTFLAITHPVPADEVVTLERGERSVTVRINDRIFTVFQFSKDRKKPFFLPVTVSGSDTLLAQATPGEPGTAGRRVIVCSETPHAVDNTGKPAHVVGLNDVLVVSKIKGDNAWIEDKNIWIALRDIAPVAASVTRLINDNPPKVKDRKSLLYYDHPHHKGIWLSVDEVNGVKFWNEDGRIENASVEIITASGNPAVLKYENHWLDQDGQPLLKEVTTVSLFANRLLKAEFALTAMQNDVTFGDTKEGMFAIRLPNSMRELVAGGPVKNSDGNSGTKAIWGQPARWIDYCGPVDGEVFGVTLMDHPENRWPSRYHVRDYGLFAINPFGTKAYTQGKEAAKSLTLKKGESIDFSYGMFVHRDVVDDDVIQQAYQQFVE